MRTRFLCIAICLGVFLLSSGLLEDAPDPSMKQEVNDLNEIEDCVLSYQSRSAFIITGDDDFLAQNFTGTGTENQPYVLQGVSIQAPSMGSAIWIRNTSVYFEIRDSLIYSSYPSVAAYGIRFENVTHGSIINCTLRNIAGGVNWENATSCAITSSIIDNTEHAIRAWFSPWMRIQNNRIYNTKDSTLYLVLSGNATISDNIIDTVTDNGLATVYAVMCGNSTISNNQFTDIANSVISLSVCPGTNIINNIMLEAGHTSVTVLQSNWTIVENNTIQMSWIGIALQQSSHCYITNNTVSHLLYDGITFHNATDNYVLNNTLCSTGYGVIYMEAQCRRNWIYGNRIGWSGSPVDNGIIGPDANHWDDGVSRGNAYSQYVGPGVMNISGSAGTVDHYPTQLADSTTPVINSPDDIIMEWNDVRIINWSISDDWPDEYTLYVDESSVEHEQFWLSGFKTVVVTGLTEGLYNYTLYIQDGAGHWVSDTVWVEVIDNKSPSLDSPMDITYEMQTGGHEITWTVGDRNPGIYRIEGNGTTVSDTAWTNGTITLGVDGFSVGVYNFTIVVLDQYDNEAKDTVFVIVEDNTPPLIVTSGDFSYNVGTTGHEISWTLGDLNPHQYRIDGNGSTVGWTPWTNGTITLDIDGYSVGVYTHTLSVVDGFGNLATDTVFVTVASDTTPPDVDTPSGVEYEQGEVGNDIVWTVGDTNPGSYSVVGNGTTVGWTSWMNGTVTLDVDGLSPGVYNHTILVRDAYGNQASSTVFVTVTDMINPDLDSPPDVYYEQGSSDNEINWVVGDRNPGFYRIDGNGTTQGWTPWTNGTITLDVDGLALGTYNFTITLADLSGNQVRDTVYVIVEDTTAPDLSPHIDIQYEVGETGNTITWLVNDLTPGIYELYLNSTLNSTASWSGTSIVIDVDGLPVGYHNFTILVFDISGNVVADTVIVHVLEVPTSTETTEPTTTTSPSTETTSATSSTPGTTSSTGPAAGLDIPLTILIVSALGAIVVLFVIVMMKR